MVFLSIPYKGPRFTGMMSNSTNAMYSDTNEAVPYGWTYNDWNKFSDRLQLARNVIYPLIAILTVLGNTLVLVATWRERSLHQPNKYFIACLAVADLLVGMFLGPMVVYQYNLDDESQLSMSIHLCRFISWIDTFSLTASIYSLTFISFDRYMKISKPLQYKSRMTTSKTLKIIFTIWLISTAFATYAATPHSGSSGILYTNRVCPVEFNNNKDKEFYTIAAVSAFFLPTVVILVMYALIFVVVHKRQMMLRNGELGQTINNQNQQTAFRQDLKVVRMLLLVVGVFILCWGPYFIDTLLWFYHPNYSDWTMSTSLSYQRRLLIYEFVIFTLPYINSLCNPIIYACLDKTYKEAFKNLFLRILCRGRSRRGRPPEAIGLHQMRT